jgi:predicted O-methyltransferase YrrM
MTEYKNSKWWNKAKAPVGEIQPEPWLHPSVIGFLESLLEPDFRILEHGSGGSTLWFASRVGRVVSVESDRDWYEKVKSLARPNTRLILWDQDTLPRITGRFDLLLIDGEPVEDRALYLDAAEKLVKPGGIVVLDNANRPEYAAARARLGRRAKSLGTFDHNEPETLYLVTDFYQLKGGAA